MNFIKNDRGSITVVVVVTILFVVAVLSSLYAINSSKRNNQLKAQSRLRNIYSNSVNVNEILH